MHMADALITPSVGGIMWVVSIGLLGYCARTVRKTLDSVKVPLMGMLGAFVFAAQMINFSIPGTGSSGHLGGGLILAILLGPQAGFIVMASVLFVQALIFADGGLLAMGCNIFNLGFIPCFVAYPLLFRPIAAKSRKSPRFWIGAIVAAMIGVLLGALCVVLQTCFSGVSELPFNSFAALMLAIHVAIGLVEGLITGGIVSLVSSMGHHSSIGDVAISPARLRAPAVLGVLSILIAVFLSWFASTHPDGLEWAVQSIAGEQSVGNDSEIHKTAADLQDKTALMPDYAPRQEPVDDVQAEAGGTSGANAVAGLVGGGITLLLAGVLGLLLGRRKPHAEH